MEERSKMLSGSQKRFSVIMANVISIVGRPNVGKSTLFNRLTESRKAIMDNQSGVTRDRHYGYGEWTDQYFTVIDTGGYVVGSEDIFEGAIREQVEMAIEESRVVLFMVDTMTGLTDLDKDFANVLRRFNKPVLLVANKSETQERYQSAAEFYELGLGDMVYAISAQTGFGTGELLDEVIKHFETSGIENPEEGIPRIAIMGRPNVGKSSFLNVLTGTERSIVTDIAGTTRDAIHTHYNAFGMEFILTDTAGIRRSPGLRKILNITLHFAQLRRWRSRMCVLYYWMQRLAWKGRILTLLARLTKRKKVLSLWSTNGIW